MASKVALSVLSHKLDIAFRWVGGAAPRLHGGFSHVCVEGGGASKVALSVLSQKLDIALL